MKFSTFFLFFSLFIYLSAVGYGFVYPQPIFVSEDSPLALLMRNMYEEATLIRQAILEKRSPKDVRKQFKAIYTATPTDPQVHDENFIPFSDNFLTALDQIYNNEDNTVENFNAMVASCVACHRHYCPGPIEKIQKLYIYP
ncbi:MAG: hypothetical protein RMJ44_00820 [Cytophagales bacterium]|nr:hypothetical protein [Cytophagales bacterium]